MNLTRTYLCTVSDAPARARASSAERKDNAEPRRTGSQQHLKLPKLTSETFDRDVWDRALQDLLYALGWDKMHELSLLEGQRAESDEDDIKVIDRRAAWGLIKLSLNDDVTAKRFLNPKVIW